ncbi:MAG: endonuclease MutS2 [Clostridiales Family XIII bacterium]|jgi:DNA mismatch repair protein MutS2|nr:endonuclease MutS2 [Clostridiales Family XIII bacterium]
MDKREYRILEFDKIRELLAERASSALAKEEIRRLEPSPAAHVIRQNLAETSEALSVVMRKGSPSLGNFQDIRGAVVHALKGGSLTMRQLLDVKNHLASARNAVNFLKSDLPDLPVISELRDLIALRRELESRIDAAILSETDMADSASAELRRIRRSISIQNESVRSKLNQIISSSGNKGLLQDQIVTVRHGRYVIPVKQEHKARFPGMIHDQSSTGATLFIEPQSIVNLNNELRELELAEEREIERVLAEFSAEVAEIGDELLNNQEIMVKLDFIFAKGKMSADTKACEPIISLDGHMRIKNGRHPLIPAVKAVPINLELGKRYKTLIITGPNTGGKTVTLKTAGLFVLMTAAGLHVPADHGTEIPVYRHVFADIGDEQSIEQSLSTFSSHMKNIVGIIDEAGEGVLALLDELGAGTDPTEGAALGIAILERLKSLGASTLATTHYTELKKYAIAAEGVENASMEFDVETLSPTFRLKTGLPGRSNAFEISRKLGLSEGIIERAAGLLDASEIRFESVISKIEADRRAAEEELDEAAALKLQLRKQQDDWDRERRRLSEKTDKLLSEARQEARDIIREAREYSDLLMKELRELPDVGDARERNRRLEADRALLRELDGKYREKTERRANPAPERNVALKAGDRVRVLDLDQEGVVASPPDEKGEMLVQIGRMKISVGVAGVTRAGAGKKKDRPAGGGHGSIYSSKVQSIAPSLSVRGENLEDALAAVDKYLDDAFLAGLRVVTLIHGRGEGVLRDGIQKMLRGHRHVKSYRRGGFGEGGDGVTVCEMKDR